MYFFPDIDSSYIQEESLLGRLKSSTDIGFRIRGLIGGGGVVF
jgi:hypothetical protein